MNDGYRPKVDNLLSFSAKDYYQVGGSLPENSPTYIQRSADEKLYEALLQHQFCFVLNARQMGKSSLWIQTSKRLMTAGYRCTVLDLNSVGTQELSLEQWYASLIVQLYRQLNLNFEFRAWWSAHHHLTPSARFMIFLEDIVLAQTQCPIVIGIDEIDSVLSLPFEVDDFFALIRSCYHQRHSNSEFKRLTFVLIGVAIPSDLINDRQRTPFNIGCAIKLTGFDYQQAQHLILGLQGLVFNPGVILETILDWTSGQPFLTQKLCSITRKKLSLIPQSEIPETIENLREWSNHIIQEHCIENWQTMDEPEHLRSIQNRLLHEKNNAGSLLTIAQKIHQQGTIFSNDSIEQTRLLLSGLVIKRGSLLMFHNRIYSTVFNLHWIERQLTELRPYAASLEKWVLSHYRDNSRLLQGQALNDALRWANEQQLGELDYRYLSTSQDYAQLLERQKLEAEKKDAVEAKLNEKKKRLQEQAKAIKRQRRMISVMTIALFVAGGLGGIALWSYSQLQRQQIKLLVTSAKALFDSHQQLDALIEGIRAKRQLEQWGIQDQKLTNQVNANLEHITQNIQELNRLTQHNSIVWSVALRPHHQQFATGSRDRTIRLWSDRGQLLQTLYSSSEIIDLAFNPAGNQLVATTSNNTLQIWIADQQGQFLNKPSKVLQDNGATVWEADFTPDGHYLVTAGGDHSIRVWAKNGELLQINRYHQSPVMGIDVSPNGQWVISSDESGNIFRWSLRNGRLADRPTHHYLGHTDRVSTVQFSPNGEQLVSVSDDQTVKIWQFDGTLKKTLDTHHAPVWAIAFRPDGQQFATGGWDNAIHLWDQDGNLIDTFLGHQNRIRDLTFNLRGNILISGSTDTTVRIWETSSQLKTTLHAHNANVIATDVHPNGGLFATSGDDYNIRLWNWSGKQIATLTGHSAGVLDIDFSPDGSLLVSSGWDSLIGLWRLDCDQHQCEIKQANFLNHHKEAVWGIDTSFDAQWVVTGSDDMTISIIPVQNQTDSPVLLMGHQSGVREVAFHPRHNLLASASLDHTIHFWSPRNHGKFGNDVKKTLSGHTASVNGIAFSPDGQLFASVSSDGSARLWSSQGNPLKTLTQKKQLEYYNVAFSANSQMVATANSLGLVEIWSRDGHLLKTLRGHRQSVRDIAFSPDQKTLISVSEDTKIILWNLDIIFRMKSIHYGCTWLRDYFHENSNQSKRNTRLCPKSNSKTVENRSP